MSPEPKRSLKIEPVEPAEEGDKSATKRASGSKRKKNLPADTAAKPSASADSAPAKKAARKPSRKSSVAVEAVEPTAGLSEAIVDSKPEPAGSAPVAVTGLPEDLEQEAVVAELAHEVAAEAEDEPSYVPPEENDAESPQERRPSAEPHLERLQKILSHAGISSRRTAEEMILGGRVQVNGQVISTLGAKADAARDHIRVDGKLLHGPERHRYFMLNKPKGYVTTVSDPEGRPTVMQFFAGERERLYPVGRLDYLSEGLLLVTNDGELANKLTRAASGVEKTYLVKVSGRPTEEMLDSLREGVVIERGRPGTGSGRVRTAPASIRQIREGDNPWYEVTVIEGRNRELRKMFEEIGHHVEKIRRVGYGPLILDLEPGKVRELDAEEVRLLNLAGDGKLKTRRRRGPAPAQLPRKAGSAVEFPKSGPKARVNRPAESAARAPKAEWGAPTQRAERRPPLRGDARFSSSARPRPERAAPEGGGPERNRFDRTGPARRFPERPGKGAPPSGRRGPERPAGKQSGRPAGKQSFDRERRRPDTGAREERPNLRAQGRDRFPERGPQRSTPRRETSAEFRPVRPAKPVGRAPQDHEDFETPRRGIRITPAEPASQGRPGRTERPRTAKTFTRPGRPAGKFPGSRPPRPSGQSGAARPADKRPGAGGSSGRSENSGAAPRKKERWRDSFTGKNKGRPKPKPRKPE